jgi:hypothetical protein
VNTALPSTPIMTPEQYAEIPTTLANVLLSTRDHSSAMA